jgi:uncharacterized protein (TIGR00369 family)
MQEQARKRILDSFAAQSLMRSYEAQITDLGTGSCEITAPLLPTMLQQHGAGHAGVTFALGDSAAGYAALSLMPDGREVMTAEIKINLLAPALGEKLIARGRVVKSGRTLSVVTSEVECVAPDGSRKLIAVMQGTMIAVDPRRA